VTSPRFFLLVSGNTTTDAIDLAESRGHVVIRSVLTQADAVPVYGICEIEEPGKMADGGAP
jgi:hypothetical protein